MTSDILVFRPSLTPAKKVLVGTALAGSLFLIPSPAKASAPPEVTAAVTATTATLAALTGIVTAAFAVCLAPVGGMLVFKFLNKLTANV